MEFAKKEIAAVQEAASKFESEVQDLEDLELSLIGGGCGDVAFG